MTVNENITPEKMSLKQLFGMLTTGQARAVVVATIGLIGGVFAAGMWVNEIRIAHSYQSRIASMITQEQHDKDVALLVADHDKKVAKLTTENDEQLNAIKAENRTLVAEIERYTLQVEFLERCHAYINARIKGRENVLNNDSDDHVESARKQFAMTLRRMYKEGDRSVQKKDGYEFDESDAENHKVIFGGVKPYRIPADVKGNFIDAL